MLKSIQLAQQVVSLRTKYNKETQTNPKIPKEAVGKTENSSWAEIRLGKQKNPTNEPHTVNPVKEPSCDPSPVPSAPLHHKTSFEKRLTFSVSR